MARLAIYLRRSSPGEEDKNYSIEDQRRDITERWAEFTRHVLVNEYSEPGGKSYTLSRPVFQQMLTDAKAGLFDLVVVGRWDRFSRDQDQMPVAIYQLQQYGVQVVSATQPIPDGPLGTLVRNAYTFSAQLQLEAIRGATYGGRRTRVLKGNLPPHAIPVYGYIFADPHEGKTRYTPDPEAAPIVQEIFRMCMAGRPIRDIARTLTERGIPTPTALWEHRGMLQKGRKASTVWNISTISRFLRSQVYIGRYVGHDTVVKEVQVTHPITGTVSTVRKTVQRPIDDPDRVEFDQSVVPPIVTQEEWDAVQVILKANKELSPRNLYDSSACLLRNGFAICGYCHRKMSTEYHKRRGYYYYRCSSHKEIRRCDGGDMAWKAPYLDDMAWKWILALAEDPDLLRKKYEIYRLTYTDETAVLYDQLAALDDLYKAADAKRLRNMDMAEKEADDEQRAEYQQRARDAAEAKRGLQKQRDALQATLRSKEEGATFIESFIQFSSQALEKLRTATFDEKRRFLYMARFEVQCFRRDHEPKYLMTWDLERTYAHALELSGVCVADHSCSYQPAPMPQ